LPVVNVGVLAVVQPVVLLPLCLWLLARWERKLPATGR